MGDSVLAIQCGRNALRCGGRVSCSFELGIVAASLGLEPMLNQAVLLKNCDHDEGLFCVSEVQKTTESSLRDRLALDRTVLANERTLLAYVRTAMMLAATGATAISFYSDRWFPLLSGWFLIALGLVIATVGASRFRNLARSLK